MNLAVTTIRKYTRAIEEEAKARAQALGLPYVPRGETLEDMAKESGFSGFLIYGKKLPTYWHGGEEYRFHVGTAVLRVGQMEKGNGDRLCDLLPKEEGLQVLDCTFGQAGDSTTLSWFVGESGQVTALEKSLALYEIGRAGIAAYEDKNPALTRAVRRIELLHEDYRDFLSRVEPKSYDVIYFDPMFKSPVKREVNDMEAFRSAAAYDSLSLETLTLAMRAARRLVIVKERPFSPIFKNGPWTKVAGKKGQTTAYGVIVVGDKG